MAVRIHGTMTRKADGSPYINHPIAVFGLLVHWGADENTCIAGLLHDVIEDVENDEERTKVRTEIEEKFGKEVLQYVEEVTEQDKSLPWKERKLQYLDGLKHHSISALLISCADRTHNTISVVHSLRDMGEEVWEKFNAPKDEQIWFMDSVLEILTDRLDKKYINELTKNIETIKVVLS